MKILSLWVLAGLLFSMPLAAMDAKEVSLRGVVRRDSGVPMEEATILVSSKIRLGSGNPFVPKTPYFFLTRTKTDRRGHFNIRVNPPANSIGYSIVIFDMPKSKVVDGTTVQYQPTLRFDVVPNQLNVIIVRGRR